MTTIKGVWSIRVNSPVLLLCFLLLAMSGLVAASPPDASGVIPAGATVESVRTLHGKAAVLQFTQQIGIDLTTFQKKTGSSPFDPSSTDISVTATHRHSTSVAQGVFDALHGEVHVLWSDGDTVTYSYTVGCTRVTQTFTWEGGPNGGWVRTGVSYVAIPGCKAPTG
jgi:hypothetical protein